MTYFLSSLRVFFACLIFVTTLSNAAFADRDRDRTQVGSNINIGPEEEVSDATCFACSIRVRGRVSGDVTAFGGSIVIEDQAQVSGSATTFGGDFRIDKAAKVAGDVTVFGGRMRRDPESAIGGDVTNMGGHGWIFLIFLMPLIILGALVGLLIWVIRRLLRPSVPAAA